MITTSRTPSSTLTCLRFNGYSEDAKESLDLSTNISGIALIALTLTKLPFNTKFSNIEYTKLTINEISGPGIFTGEKLSNENSADKSYVLKWLFS